MPTIQYNKQGGGKITYDEKDWFAGFDKIQTTALTTSKIGNGFARMQRVNPYRSMGHLTVSHESTDISNPATVTGLIKNAVINGNNAYLVATDKVHKLGTLATGTINTTSPFPYTIVHGAHTGMTGSDIVNYYVGSTLKAFFSFHDNTDWDVGVYDYTANTFDGDFMSTIPATPLAGTDLTDGKDIEHPMIVGDDDILYMGSGRDVHAFDGQTGANGTFYSKVLTLPEGWYITCFEKLPNNKLAIGAYYSSSKGTYFNKGEARVWIWGYLELDIETSYDLSDNYISELFNWNGTMACFTSGRQSATMSSEYKLQVFDGTKFNTVVQYKDGGLPIRGGVDIIGTDIYWNAKGGIYSFVKNPFTGEYMFNNIAGDNARTSGMLKFLSANFNIHTSRGVSTHYGLQYHGGNNYGTGFCYLKGVTLGVPNERKARITTISITFKETITAGGRELTLAFSVDGASKEYIAAFEAVSARKIKYEDKSDGKTFDEFNELQPTLTWGSGTGNSKAPTIEKLEIEFETINL